MITYIFNRNDIVISSDYPHSELIFDVFREHSLFLRTQPSDSFNIIPHGLEVLLTGVILQAWPNVQDIYPQMILTYDKYVYIFSGDFVSIYKTNSMAQALYDAYHEFLVALDLEYPTVSLSLNHDYGPLMGLLFQQQIYDSTVSTFHPLRS